MMGNVKKISFIACMVILLAIPYLLRVSGVTTSPPFNKFKVRGVFPNMKFQPGFTSNPSEKTFSDSIVQYYSDASGFRELLIPVFLGIKNYLFHVSPYPGKVVYGLNGWFFLGDEYSDVIRESKGLIKFSDNELQKIRENVDNASNYCRKRNIRFYLAIVPDKSSVYGTSLPIEKANQPTKFDQVKSIHTNSNFKIIDVGGDFNQFGNRELYLKTDSHWNHFGLFIGYQTLMNEISIDFSNIHVLNLDQFKIDSVEDYSGDLTKMISLRVRDQKIGLTPIFKTEATIEKTRIPLPKKYTRSIFERRFVNKNKKYKALIFHNSFFKFMPKFMKENFRESVFLRSSFNYTIIDSEKPDLIIYQIAERELDVLLNDLVVPWH
jgi:hypothetical protein